MTTQKYKQNSVPPNCQIKGKLPLLLKLPRKFKTDKNCLATIKIAKVAIAIEYLLWKQHYVCNLNTVTQLLKYFKYYNL